MINTKIKLLAIDLDQTLTDHNDIVDVDDFFAIQKLQKAGIKVVIATGRSLDGTLPIYRKLKMADYKVPIVCLNGAFVYDVAQKKVISTDVIAPNVLKQILVLPEVGKLFIDLQMNHFTCQKNSFVRDFINTYHQSVQCITPESLLTKKIISGFLLHSDLDKINRLIVNIKDQRIRFASSFDTGTQFSNTSKFEGINHLAKIWGITPSEMMAIGDNLNDLELLKKVRYGIAIGNAKPTLKQIAYATTSNWNTNGVAKAIAKHFYNL